MKIAVSSNGNDLSAQASPVFGRCPYYIFVDTESMEFEAVANPAISAPGGAGIQAAQFVANQGAQVVLTGNVGPNAFNVLQSAGVQVLTVAGGTVKEAVEAYKEGRLQGITGPSAGPYAGMGGRGMGTGRGMGMGRGMGLGRGMGGGMGMGGGWGGYGPQVVPPTPSPAGTPPSAPREDISALTAQTEALRKQLDEVMRRIEELEKKEKE